MKSLRFLPFLAACLSLGAHPSAADFSAMPQKDKERRKFRSKRDRTTKSIFGRRWNWNIPHVGVQQAERLAKRAVADTRAAAMNSAWRGNKTLSQQP